MDSTTTNRTFSQEETQIIEVQSASTSTIVVEETSLEVTTEAVPEQSTNEDDRKRHEKEEEDDRPSKKQKLDETIDEDGTLCVICYEIWDQTGDHRISALKCGHLFGQKCILRWLAENKVCPTCKAKATKRDIRFIYANKLIAVDNGEMTRLQTELDSVKAENSNLQIELTSVLCKLTLVNGEIEQYKSQIEKLKNAPMYSQEIKPVEKSVSLKYVGNYMVCPQGSCRVMTCILSKSSLVASMKSGNNLFPGFGVKQFNSENFISLSYTPLHTKVIRDISFNQSNARLLSVSLDKHFSLANIFSSETNIKQSCDDMLWSCCWDASNSNIFYVGGQQGTVKVYDSRYISDTPLSTHSIEGDLSPVVSIVSIPSSPDSAMPQGGFIACKLNSLWAFEKTGSTLSKQLLPVEGPFVSMTYHEEDRHLLISARPNSQEQCARHIVCNLSKDAGVLGCNRIHTFTSGRMQKQLARSCFLQKSNFTYVATPNDMTVQLWNSQTGFPATVGRTSGAIIDLLPLKNSNGTHLVALSEKKLNVFKLIDL